MPRLHDVIESSELSAEQFFNWQNCLSKTTGMSMIINVTNGIIWLPMAVPRTHLILLMVGLAIFGVWKPTLFKAHDACLLFECLCYICFG